jgi:Na+/melibiose symporter-like transporter
MALSSIGFGTKLVYGFGTVAYGVAAAVLMFVSILISTAGTHHYIPYLRSPPPKRPFNLSREAREIRAALANRPFLSMIACGFFSAMALGLVATLSVNFYTYYWELSADQISLLLLSALISAGAALGVAPAITRRAITPIFSFCTLDRPRIETPRANHYKPCRNPPIPKR